MQAWGEFNYLLEASAGQVKYTQQPERSVLKLDTRRLPVADMREGDPAPALDNEGFMLARLPFATSSGEDTDAIAAAANPLLVDFIGKLTGAPKIVLRKPIVRKSPVLTPGDRHARGPSTYVHGDFSGDVFHDMAHDAVAGDPECDRWLTGRYCVIQTWRVLSPPPQDFPLALLDRRTVAPDELVPLRTVIGGPGREEAFWNFSLRYNPAHRWSYVPDMTVEDVLVFIGSESWNRIPGILHSGFDNSGNVNRTNPRISVEQRAFVFFG